MITNLKITKYLFFFLISIAFLTFTTVVQAQEAPEDTAKKYNVSFPIEKLGSCTDYSTCRTFCEDPVNSTACVAFAKEKGFYKEDPVVTQKDQILAKARTEVGCGTHAECKAFCEVPANYPTCASFAQKSGLRGGYVASPENQSVVTKAKEVLGCSSPTECASFCSNPDNHDKCSGFAKQVGLHGGQEARGPGGCTSSETCKTYCSDPSNYQQCSNFAGGQGQFKGPGGCTSQDSCQNFCEQNPAQCKMVSADPNGGPGLIDNPQKAAVEFKKYCEANSDNCSSKGTGFFSNKDARLEFEQFCSANPESCGAKTHFKQLEPQNRKAEYENFCKTNPSGCETGPGGYAVPKGTSGGFIDPKEYCRKDPSRCPNEQRYEERFTINSSYDPVNTCNNTPSCGWENGSCRCGDNRKSEDGATGGSKKCMGMPANGCGPNSWWDYGSCSCKSTTGSQTGGFSGGSDSSRAADGCKSAGGSWMGNYCKMPQNNSGSSGGSSGNYSSGGYPGGPGAPYPGKSSSGGGAFGGGYDASGKYVGGSYGGYDSAGNYVGTGSSGGSSGSTGGSQQSGSSDSYSSMSPSEGCSRAGGSWNGSSCQMPLSGSSGGSNPTPQPQQPQETPAQSQPQQQSDQPQETPAQSQPQQEPAPAPEAQPAPPPPTSVQGVSISQGSLLERFLNFLFK